MAVPGPDSNYHRSLPCSNAGFMGRIFYRRKNDLIEFCQPYCKRTRSNRQVNNLKLHFLFLDEKEA